VILKLTEFDGQLTADDADSDTYLAEMDDEKVAVSSDEQVLNTKRRKINGAVRFPPPSPPPRHPSIELITHTVVPCSRAADCNNPLRENDANISFFIFKQN
jgi:hypothetical protein